MVPLEISKNKIWDKIDVAQEQIDFSSANKKNSV